MGSARGNDTILVLTASVPVLALRLGATYLRFLARRRRGVRTFERALRSGGMPKEDAAKLAETYMSAGSLRGLIQSATSRRDAD